VYDDLSDLDLARQCLAGHQGAWSTLVRRFQRLIYTIPRRAGLSDDEAADVFQASFVRLHEQLHRIDDLGRVRAWLVTTARRETLRVLEESRRRVLIPADPDSDEDPLDAIPDPAPLPEALLADLQQQDRVRQAVDRLDPRSRQFVELVFLQEEPLPYSEIAARLNIAGGSIGPTRARCLAKIRQILANL
jgi:RNA polymerase sigma factor (sigma-70 family)